MKHIRTSRMQYLALLVFILRINQIAALDEINHPIPTPAHATQITAEVSLGELMDKITILMIKEERMTDPIKLHNVKEELHTLLRTKKRYITHSVELQNLMDELLNVNKRLWDIEDLIRDKERIQCFDAEFIELARAVYNINDTRFVIKQSINKLLSSRIIEEKSYKPYK